MSTLPDQITLSIVSHGQAFLIRDLLNDLAALTQPNFEVIITVNLPEDESIYQGFPFPMRIIRNTSPKGFGDNHNAAFLCSTTQWFAVVNPDIRIQSLDFEVLLRPFQANQIAALAPVVLSAEGMVEDSARRFPSLLQFAKRVLLRQRNSDYEVQSTPYEVDWVAGMFIVFRREAFQRVGGFDARRFYMYLEDADICNRLGKEGWQVIVNPHIQVIHMAQRASHRSLKHMRWHAVSALRFLIGL
ncbi:MAG TPA: glycosyltransferase [Cellvibrionaceae bacterium]